MSSHSRFMDALQTVYRDVPCEVLPNALWKTRIHLNHCETCVWYESGQITALSMRSQDVLYVYWQRARDGSAIRPVDWTDFHLALLHQDFDAYVPDNHFSQRTAYFRLIHRGTPPATVCPGGFRVEDVYVEAEAESVAAFIDACYTTISPTVDEVRIWMKHPAFDPDLWIWMMDAETDQPAGLGIAEFDPTIREGALEWIQVLPRYRGRGLGTTLVRELLRRLDGRVDFTTVAGLINNPTRPEQLYRRCGFMGSDRWFVYRR